MKRPVVLSLSHRRQVCALALGRGGHFEFIVGRKSGSQTKVWTLAASVVLIKLQLLGRQNWVLSGCQA